jgi:hypothetical protein
MSSLATALRQELARLLEPLIVAAGSAERWPLVLALVGHTADVAGNPALRAALDDLGALANLHDLDVETWDGIQAILTAAARATKALHEIEHAASDPALGERLKQLGPDLAQQLTAVYLRRFHPRLFRLLGIFGIVDPAEAHAPQPAQLVGDAVVRSAWSGDQLHLDRLGPLLRDPWTALRAAYLPNDLRTAADAHAAADRLFPLLRAAFDELGLASSVERRSLTPDEPGDPQGDGGHFNSPEPSPEDAPPSPPAPDLGPYYRTTQPRLTIRIPQLQPDGSLAGTFLGIDVVASSLEHPGAVAGLILALTGALNWTETRGPLTIKFETDGQVPALSIGPQGMKLAPASAALTGATGRLSVTLAADGAPAFSLGDPKGTRLELGKAQLGADFSATPTRVAAGLTVAVDKAVLALEPGDGDGFVASLLPSGGLRAEFDFGVTLSSDKGFALHGKAGLDATIPVGLSLGGISLTTLTIGIRAVDAQLAAEVSASLSAVIGPVQVSLDRIGLDARLTFPDGGGGNLGVADLAIGFQPPRGAGIAIDAAGVVTGGGFLFHDPVRQLYAGVVQLSLHERLTLKAFGLVATTMPDGSRGYSMIVFITAEGFQPIPLGLGFTLNGIGGTVAIHRTFDEDVLRAGLKSDTLGALLFPRDPVGNAPAVVASLAAAFPALQGSYLLGLLVRIGWFSPTLVLLELALILQLGARRRLLVLGRVSALLPSPDNDLVRLILDSMGVIDFDEGTVSIDAILVDSRLAHKFPLTGAMALRARWSSGPGSTFVLAVGGLNPHFAPPEGLPALQRVSIALSSGDNPRLTCDAYFAITSNTVQFGAHAQLYAAAFGFSVEGDIGFDVLIQIAPLHFIADFDAKVQLKHGSSNLFMVSVDGELEGPRPLRVSGKASFSIFWCDFSVRFDKTLVDGEGPPPPPAIDVLAQLMAALVSPASWTAERAAQGQGQGVALKALPASTGLVLEPLGRLVVQQQVVPLNTGRDVEIFGGAPVSGARRFHLTATLNGASQHADSVRDQFAPAQFFELSDDEKLAAPSFETMDAGLVFGDQAVSFDAGQIVAAPLQYEQIVVDDLAAPPPPPAQAPPRQTFTLRADRLLALSDSGAAARAPLRSVGRARFRAADGSPAATLQPPAWRIVSLTDGAPAAVDPSVKTWSEHLAAVSTLNRAGATWQIVPAHELAD